MKRTALLLLAALGAGNLTACGSGGSSPPPTADAGTVVVVVSPKTQALGQGTSFTFSARVTGTANTAVSWSVAGGSNNGTITSAGVYTAPFSSGGFSVVATSVADSSKSDSAAVSVQLLG